MYYKARTFLAFNFPFFFPVDVPLSPTPSAHENITNMNDPDADISSDTSEVFPTADEGMRQRVEMS